MSPISSDSRTAAKWHTLPLDRKKFLHLSALVIIGLTGALILTARLNPGRMDYIEYWSSGKLLLHRLDSYSPSAIFALEKAHGYLPSSPLIMPNPPWTLFLTVPLGFVSARVGVFLWTVIAAACIVASVHLLNPRSKDNALALLFAPAIACFGSGQSSPFLLLGFSLFLRFHRSRPFLAGTALLLMAIKPHLFLIFWVVLLIDSTEKRGFRILAGAASATLTTTLFAMCFDGSIWRHYFSMLREHHPAEGFLPTLSNLLRVLAHFHEFWVLFVPSAIAVLWGVWYYNHHRRHWDWQIHGMLLMLVTILVSPYGFFTDEIVLLPCLIFALNYPHLSKNAGWMLLGINSAAAIIFMALGASLTSPAYLWTPIAWLAWFLYATSGLRFHELSRPAAEPQLV